MRLYPPCVVYEIRLVKRVWMINRAPKRDCGKRSLCTRESINKITKHREAAARRKRQRPLRVERNELLRYLAHHVRSCSNCMGSGGIGDCVLDLIVVENAALREERR